MTASNSAQAAARANEPSMEEILASIRKIIAEDQRPLAAEDLPQEAAMAAAPAMNDDADADDDVLDLAAPATAASPSPAPAPAALRPGQPEPAPATVVPAASLVSDTTAQMTGASFQSLANAVFTQNARTMDDLVKEMLRPMLTSWLDENLPSLVERLVRAEIERVARGGR